MAAEGITRSGGFAPRSDGDAGRVKRHGALILTVVLAGAILSAFAVAGQTRAVAPVSVLAVLAGRVELAHGADAYAAARDGQTVAAGDRVRTDDAGHAVVTFFDGSTLDIGSATEVAIESAASPGGTVDLVISQAIGRTFSSVHKLVDPRSRYEIRTPSLVAAVRGTKFEVQVAADGSAAERTSEGLVAVSSAGAEVFVPAGAGTHATPGTPPAVPAPVPASQSGVGTGIAPAHRGIHGWPGDLIGSPPGLVANPGNAPSGLVANPKDAPSGLVANPGNAQSVAPGPVPPLTPLPPTQPGVPVAFVPTVVPTVVPAPKVTVSLLAAPSVAAPSTVSARPPRLLP